MLVLKGRMQRDEWRLTVAVSSGSGSVPHNQRIERMALPSAAATAHPPVIRTEKEYMMLSKKALIIYTSAFAAKIFRNAWPLLFLGVSVIYSSCTVGNMIQYNQEAKIIKLSYEQKREYESELRDVELMLKASPRDSSLEKRRSKIINRIQKLDEDIRYYQMSSKREAEQIYRYKP